MLSKESVTDINLYWDSLEQNIIVSNCTQDILLVTHNDIGETFAKLS